MREAMVTLTKEAAGVVSEDTVASEVALTCWTVLSSEGSVHIRVVGTLQNAKI